MKNYKIFSFVVYLLSILNVQFLSDCEAQISIIPEPTKMEIKTGYFEINSATSILTTRETQSLGDKLVKILAPATGLTLKTKTDTNQQTNTIQLKLDKSLATTGDEGYRLTVSSNTVLIEAAEEAGVFYGIQTLRQLLPVEIFDKKRASGVKWQIPCVVIEDTPRFKWRGMHMDVGRYFMPKDFVKKYIDLLAIHKMNTFHWHLTEDQGWRIEIKKYPKLTEIGAWRKETVLGRNTNKYDGKKHGGFYTQAEIREIVAYAKERYITIVPEIEMPGHSVAALAAYPEYSCTGGPFEVETRWGVKSNVYCAGNDKTIEFLQDILLEVLELFPGEYIHIGGDECPKSRWEKCPKCQARIKAEGLKNEHELQSWFIKQMDTFLTERGRRLLGWDEILEGGLAPGATIMSWRGEKGGISAAKAGHDVVMAPNSYTYFDYYQAQPNNEPLAIGGFLPIDKVYSYNPTPSVLSDKEKERILGVQAQLWTEYIPTSSHLEYMAFPRACALSEVAWTSKEKKEFSEFYERLKTHLKRLDYIEVNYRKPDPIKIMLGNWKSGQTTEEFKPTEWDITSQINEPGLYTITFQYTGGAHRLDIQKVELLRDGKVIANDEHTGITGSKTVDNTYKIKFDKYSSSSKYTLRAGIRSDGGSDSNGNIYISKQE